MKCPLLVSDTADPSSYFFFQNAQKRQKDKKDSRSPRRFARPGATSIPTGFGLRLSFCRFCLEPLSATDSFVTPKCPIWVDTDQTNAEKCLRMRKLILFLYSSFCITIFAEEKVISLYPD